MKTVPEEIASLGPDGTQWFGGLVDRSRVTLRVMGPDVDVRLVSELLQHESEQFKGQGWRLRVLKAKPADLDGQIESLLSKLNPDVSAWRELTRLYRVDVFCGLFLERPNRGLQLAPTTMLRLAERNVTLSLDIYADFEEAGT
jgi:Domain of unknown function (DUF4279)